MAIDRRVVRTRTALYDALVSLIRSKPYEDITVEDILARADVGRATFYSHFTSKDNLLEKSLDRLHALLRDAIEAGGSSSGAGSQRWDPCRTLFEHVQSYRDVQLALAPGRGGGVLREAVDRVLVRLIQPLVAADTANTLPAALVTQHIVATFHTVMTWWFSARPEMPAAEADALFRQMLLQPVSLAGYEGFMGQGTAKSGARS